MKSDNQQITILILSGAFFLSFPFLIQDNLESTRSLKTSQIVKQIRPKVKKQARVPANKSPYSIEDFKPKNLLNKKLLTEQQYNDALEASKHVGISYELPNPDLDYKLSRKDLAPVRAVEKAVYVANSQRKELRLKQLNSTKE